MASQTYQPALPGDTLDVVDTPILVADLDVVEANFVKLRETLKGVEHTRIRPHAKAHKSVEIARMAMKYGAVGVCCQKMCEAEPIARAGIKDILLTNEVVGDRKLKRMGSLVKETGVRLGVMVDDENNLQDLQRICEQFDISLDVYVEVNVGQNRCGVAPASDSMLQLCKQAVQAPRLRFMGLQCYQGALQHVREYTDMQSHVAQVCDKARASVELLKKSDIKCHVVTGGGTGTYLLEAGFGVHNECQPGSFIYMDADYARNKDKTGNLVSTFKHSLFVVTRVMSASETHAVVDAGMKAVSLDSGPPTVGLLTPSGDGSAGLTFDAVKGVEYVCGGDEHGVLRYDPALMSSADHFKVGDVVALIPGHCDPTVNLYDYTVALRAGKVSHIFANEGRGQGL